MLIVVYDCISALLKVNVGWVMFTEVSTGTVTATVAGYVASFLFDEGGSNIVEGMKKKLDRQKFKKRERVFFEYHFRDVKDEHELKIILDFIDGKVVRDNLWYSHEDKISIEQQDSIWLEFQNFIKRENGDSYAPLEHKEKLSKCANFHNKLVNEIVLSEKDHLVINALLNKQKEMAEAMTEAMKVVTKEATKEMMVEIMEKATKEAVNETMKKARLTNRPVVLSNKDKGLNSYMKKYSNWLIYTFSMGCLPVTIKFIIGYIYEKKIVFDDYYAELFFMTIVFLIDAIRNFSNSNNTFANFAEKFAALMLTLSASIYGSILITQFDAVASHIRISTVFLFIASILDILSINQITID